MRTRSAQKAYMRITRWLPNEVLTEIIQNAPRADLVTLCRVSKLFHALALPSLNQTVVLETSMRRREVLEAFCRAIMQSPERADSLRSLSFTSGYLYRSLPAEDSLIESLRLMRRLEHLVIQDFRPLGVVSCLARLTFPNLLSFSLTYPASGWKTHVEDFLSRHPTITHLRLWLIGGEDPVPEGALLPKLQYYHGTARLLSAFSKHRLQCVRTAWAENADVPVTCASIVIEKLGVQASPNLASLSIVCINATQASDAIIHLSNHTSHLQKLKLHSYARYITRAMVNDITACLPRFERLKYLLFDYAHKGDRLVYDVGEDEEPEILKTWANSSSTLRGCRFCEIACVKVGQKWEECSPEELDAEAGFDERRASRRDP
ncbi:hypothetical protein FB45DRAFT_493294 [Roridomyces roridus]|uniref:F-box domain-containing protein n=1 Tax=Roridomyces roridus TaxID=1738132 RepID=A0AAD7AZN9_9AGAR|nr:hypothetical protein FB45DRAFT_493294 [Roridomyces roridus]